MAEFTNELMKWLGGSHSPWHTVDMAAHWLTERGFEPLALNKPFSVRRGGVGLSNILDNELNRGKPMEGSHR